MEIRVRQRSTTMKRTVNVLSKLNWGTRACAVLVLCATTAIALPAQTLTTLYSFCSQSGCADDANPTAGLVQATNGDLYGTTSGFPNGNNGTVFKITPGGTLTTLYGFCSQSGCTDGAAPYAGLVQAANGDLYGTTQYGGTNGDYGTVFKITPSGTLTTLYSFCSQTNCADGDEPVAGLVQAANGDFYGTTGGGGANVYYGTVFKITPSGTLTTLYNFCPQSGCTDGGNPDAMQLRPPKRVHGRPPRRWARPGRQWGLLRDNVLWWGQTLRRDGLQNHTEWHADPAIQVLLPKRVPGRQQPQRWARPGRRWGMLRDNVWRWGQQLWHRLQNHLGWHADDAIQLLLPKRVPGRQRPQRWARPGHQWGLLRDNA